MEFKFEFVISKRSQEAGSKKPSETWTTGNKKDGNQNLGNKRLDWFAGGAVNECERSKKQTNMETDEQKEKTSIVAYKIFVLF